MPLIVVVLSMILAWFASAPAAAQTFPAGNVPGRESPPPSFYPAPTYPTASPAPLDDRQVNAAAFQQPATAVPASSPTAPGPAAAGVPPGSIPLLPPSHKYDASNSLGGHGSPGERGGMPSPLTVAGSLAFVLGLFFLVAWVMRRATPGAARLLPKEVVEVLGRAPLAGRQQMHLLRCGHKLLLVCATPAGVETLTEITDPMEVDRLAGLCQQTRSDSATTMFRHVFEQLAETPRPAPRRSARHIHDEVELANAGIPGGEPDGVEDGRV
jgi:flagellar biogenesis protein FliO